MKSMLAAVATFCLLGCGGFQEAMEAQKAPAANAPAEPKPVAQPQPKKAPPKDKKGIIGKMTNKVVDMQKAMQENPNWVVVDDPYSISASDPITQSTKAYINKRAQVSQFGVESWLKQFKILNERNPTYEEYIGLMQQYNIKFAMLPHYRTWAYDSETGETKILEDQTLR